MRGRLDGEVPNLGKFAACLAVALEQNRKNPFPQSQLQRNPPTLLLKYGEKADFSRYFLNKPDQTVVLGQSVRVSL